MRRRHCQIPAFVSPLLLYRKLSKHHSCATFWRQNIHYFFSKGSKVRRLSRGSSRKDSPYKTSSNLRSVHRRCRRCRVRSQQIEEQEEAGNNRGKLFLVTLRNNHESIRCSSYLAKPCVWREFLSTPNFYTSEEKECYISFICSVHR